MFLGFDISTSIIGWSILDSQGELFRWGYVKMNKKSLEKNLFLKMDYALDLIFDSISDIKDQITVWGVEEAAKKFTAGKSSAGIIFKCASFNFGISYGIYNFLEKEPIYIPPLTTRKLVGLKIPRGLSPYDKKSTVVEWCIPRYPSIEWGRTRTNKYSPWCFDVADSLVLTEALRIKHGSNSPTTMGNNR